MAGRKRMEPLSLEELENNPCTAGLEEVLLFRSPRSQSAPTVGLMPTVCPEPTVSSVPTVGLAPTVGNPRVRPIRDVQDALTLAGQVLYKSMYGLPDDAFSKACRKGYRQLAAETNLDKDTVRDLIADFKAKGIIRQTGAYDPDTRSAKTYEVLSVKTILQMWRNAGIRHVRAGRRPRFCDAVGSPLTFTPTVGIVPTVGSDPAVSS